METISLEHATEIKKEIKNLLHAHRDELRNKFHSKILGIQVEDENYFENISSVIKNFLNVSFSAHSPYYGEAFGILRTLRIMKYGDFGPVNIANQEGYPADDLRRGIWNLSNWFYSIKEEVLEEENYTGNNECSYCKEKYHKDHRSCLEVVKDKEFAFVLKLKVEDLALHVDKKFYFEDTMKLLKGGLNGC